MRHAIILIVPILACVGVVLAGDKPTSRPGAHATSRPVELGVCGSLNGRQLLPADNEWNRDISKDAVDPMSDKIIARIGKDRPLHPDFGSKYGIPYVVVTAKQPKVPVTFEYADESDKGPYPIPADAPIEGGADSKGDRHVLVLDRDNWLLYEMWSSYPQNGGKSWKAGSGAIFNLKTNKLRPAGWTSSDAAGLPVLPGLVRADEVLDQKELTHAVRFTVVKTRRAYIAPATHFASSANDTDLPPMGMRVRLKADFDISKFPPADQVILRGLKKYGMILADNGSNWFVTGTIDKRWDDEVLNALKKVKGRDFEVVKMGKMTTK